MDKEVIEIKMSLEQRLVLLGSTGRIADIIGDEGYEKLINLYAEQTEESKKKIELLHRFAGWMIAYAKQGYVQYKENKDA